MRKICVIVFALRRSVSFCGAVNWEFDVSSERVIPNQFAFLVWESPSNLGQSIVIQAVPFVLFSGIYLCVIEKWYSYPGDCHTSLRTGSQ